jgi:hypothetical protein
VTGCSKISFHTPIEQPSGNEWWETDDRLLAIPRNRANPETIRALLLKCIEFVVVVQLGSGILA